MSEWIKTTVRMPEVNKKVIGYTNADGVIYGLCHDGNDWISTYFWWTGDVVTHWMPIPDKPEQEE